MTDIRDLHEYSPPSWLGTLKNIPRHRLALAQRPTPLRRWRAPVGGQPVELWIKRDDLTGMTLSGNKARKLEFLLAEAVSRGCNTVLTCGGIQSNHCRATAVAARELGMDCHVLLNHVQTQDDPGLAGNLLIDRLVGAVVHLITWEQYQQRETLLSELAGQLTREGKKPYIIPEGGSNVLGTWGYLEAVNEIVHQIAELKLDLTDAVFACGSGGTAAGLSLGAHLAQWPVRVHAVSVCNTAAYFHAKIDALFDSLGAGVRSTEVLDIVEGYVGLGYAKSRPEELARLRDVALKTGVILDPVYTGKAFHGLCEEWKKVPERFKGNRILFIHTGGLFGLYDKTSEIAPLLPAQNGGWEHGQAHA